MSSLKKRLPLAQAFSWLGQKLKLFPTFNVGIDTQACQEKGRRFLIAVLAVNQVHGLYKLDQLAPTLRCNKMR